jgi:hypothetical protein
MEMPHPSEEHKALEMLVGEWLGQETIHPSPFDPIGGPAIGRVHNRIALDGFAVVQDYEQERNGVVNFRGHAIFRWDSTDRCYVLHWFDSFGTAPAEYRGAMDHRVLTLTGPTTGGLARAIFDFSNLGKYHYKLEISADGDQWSVFTDGDYRRSGE